MREIYVITPYENITDDMIWTSNCQANAIRVFDSTETPSVKYGILRFNYSELPFSLLECFYTNSTDSLEAKIGELTA